MRDHFAIIEQRVAAGTPPTMDACPNTSTAALPDETLGSPALREILRTIELIQMNTGLARLPGSLSSWTQPESINYLELRRLIPSMRTSQARHPRRWDESRLGLVEFRWSELLNFIDADSVPVSDGAILCKPVQAAVPPERQSCTAAVPDGRRDGACGVQLPGAVNAIGLKKERLREWLESRSEEVPMPIQQERSSVNERAL